MQKRLKTAYNKAFRKISQNVNIAGFRKGKAPKNIVENMLEPKESRLKPLKTFSLKNFQR